MKNLLLISFSTDFLPDLVIVIPVVDESLHLGHITVVNELLEVELVGLVSGDLPESQEARH